MGFASISLLVFVLFFFSSVRHVCSRRANKNRRRINSVMSMSVENEKKENSNGSAGWTSSFLFLLLSSSSSRYYIIFDNSSSNADSRNVSNRRKKDEGEEEEDGEQRGERETEGNKSLDESHTRARACACLSMFLLWPEFFARDNDQSSRGKELEIVIFSRSEGMKANVFGVVLPTSRS